MLEFPGGWMVWLVLIYVVAVTTTYGVERLGGAIGSRIGRWRRERSLARLLDQYPEWDDEQIDRARAYIVDQRPIEEINGQWSQSPSRSTTTAHLDGGIAYTVLSLLGLYIWGMFAYVLIRAWPLPAPRLELLDFVGFALALIIMGAFTWTFAVWPTQHLIRQARALIARRAERRRVL